MKLYQISCHRNLDNSDSIHLQATNTFQSINSRIIGVELFNILFHFQTIPPTPNCRVDRPALGPRVAALQPLPHPLRLRAEAGDSAPGRGGALQAAQPQRGAGPRDHQQVLVA